MFLLICGCGAKKSRLPEQVPAIPVLQETGPDSGWPPQVAGATNIHSVPWVPIPGSLTDSLEANLRRIAEGDSRVRQALGTRFTFLGADEIDLPKNEERKPGQALPIRLTFFNYDGNIAVEVRMVDSRVDSVMHREGYDPPEGQEEIAMAAALARRDPRLAHMGSDLHPKGILVFSPEERGPGRDRVLRISFFAGEEDLPRFFALVDLTRQAVLSAGPLR